MKTFLILAALLQQPSAREIAQLLASPTDTNCENFDAHYGRGAAARYINPKHGVTK